MQRKETLMQQLLKEKEQLRDELKRKELALENATAGLSTCMMHC